MAHPDSYRKTALITGAAKRIGRTIALDLAKAGWSLALHYNSSREEALALAAELQSLGVAAAAFQADLTREEEVSELLPKAMAELGPIACLINNASVFEMDVIGSMTRESWDSHLEPNLRAPLVLSQAFAKALPEEEGGCVINMLDQRVWSLTPYFLSYTVSKSALWTLTRTLALALAPRIRVNGIGPGPALPSKHQSQKQFDRQCQRMPLGRGTNPQEIADAVRFILGAKSMTGQMIALDGGQHLGWNQEDPNRPVYPGVFKE